MSISLESEKTTAETTQPTTQIDKSNEATMDARSWFLSLSSEECAAAMSFRDGPLLASFLQLTSATTTTTTTPSLVAGLARGAFEVEDLMMSVDEKEWETTLSRHQPTQVEGSDATGTEEVSGAKASDGAGEKKPEPQAAVTLPSSGTEESAGKKKEGEKQEEAADAATPSKEEPPSTEAAKEEAEVFRIQDECESQSKEGDVVVATKAPAAVVVDSKGADAVAVEAVKPDKTETTNENKQGGNKQATAFSETAKEIAENICVVSPSAVGSTGDIPFVSLHPVFLKTKGTSASIQALDNIFQAVSPTSEFLTFDFPQAKHSSVEQLCLKRLSSLMDSASDNKAPVLLFLLMLVRLEVAVYMAFCEKGVVNKSVATETEAAKAGPSLRNTHISELVEQLDTLARYLPALEMSKLKTIVAPLMEGGYCSLEGHDTKSDGSKLQNLLVMPLPSLVNLFSSVKASDHDAFQSWNEAWTATSRNLLDFSKTFTASVQSTPPNTTASTELKSSNSCTSNTPHVSSETSEQSSTSNSTLSVKGTLSEIDALNGNDTASSNPTTPSTSKKARRKRKKRNRRKNSNANTDATATPQKADQPNLESTISEGAVEEAAAKTESSSPVETDTTATTSDKIADVSKETNAPSSKDEKAKITSVVTESDAASDLVVTVPAKDSEAPKPNEKANTDVDGIAASVSFDSATIQPSKSDETASTKSAPPTREETTTTPADKSDFTVSRVHGVGTVVVAPSTTDEAPVPSSDEVKAEGTQQAEVTTSDDKHDEWETVEVKGRGNRKKSGRTSSQSSSASNGQKKNKSTRTPASRKRVANRKMVKEILSSVLDTVDEEVRRRRQQESRKARSIAPTPAPSAWKERSRTPVVTESSKKEKTLRDVVMGPKEVVTPKRIPPSMAKVDAASKVKGSVAQTSTAPARTRQRSSANASPVKGSKTQAGADQNTAPTIPETVSAVSDPRRAAPNNRRDMTRSDSSSIDTDDNRKQERASMPTNSGKIPASPEPPLPTLLNPGNVNSASSSVASSLEAPHASHGHHHTSTSNEVDVGYHLLDVCDRLTRDMHMFMERRASALSNRRRERGALLSALQDSVSSIWSGHSHVELYGSCATMLDLPSSDLDVVVCGLDQMEVTMSASSSPQKNMPTFNGSASESATPDKLSADSQMRHSMPHYVPTHMNADRVLLLAAELERQPWAVHVKAIPTASVPVVKVLADPYRLPGASPPVVEAEEWMMQQHQAATQNATGPASPASDGSPKTEASQANSPLYQPAMSPAWRGADVLNGLLKLDITFEGPEHGGIGSTEFSARVVQTVCDETGLPPEGTAFVQVIMVVKELLAQRRLNEPFSGGLSSYSLLLLVLAVMCERKVIREELDRVERQRRVVAGGGGNSELTGATSKVKSEKPTKQHDQINAHRSPSGNNAATAGLKANTASAKSDQKGSGGQQKTPQGAKALAKSAAQRPQAGSQPRATNQARGANGGGGNANGPNPRNHNSGSTPRSSEKPSKSPGNSWASIAMGKNDGPATAKKQESPPKKAPQLTKPSSFADAVARNAAGGNKGKSATAAPWTKQNSSGAIQQQPHQGNSAAGRGQTGKKANQKQPANQKQLPAKGEQKARSAAQKAAEVTSPATEQQSENAASAKATKDESERKIEADEKTSKFNNYSSEPVEPAISSNQSAFPQGFNDVIEVLCSGETTPGKLLMHFLLFYGQHYDAHATAIDISGKHPRDIANQSPPYTHLSPYIQRRSAGAIDPITGMLTVDPIVVYDPLEGAENNNVARRCFLWSSVKWVFAQSYMTLSSAVEQNTSPPGTPGAGTKDTASRANSNANKKQSPGPAEGAAWKGPYNPTEGGGLFDPQSPLLELLLSF